MLVMYLHTFTLLMTIRNALETFWYQCTLKQCDLQYSVLGERAWKDQGRSISKDKLQVSEGKTSVCHLVNFFIYHYSTL